jgi:hypothetical protein
MKKSSNPYRVKTTETVRRRIHKDLAQVIDKEREKHQKVCDHRYGKNKYKVPTTFITKVIGRMLK